MEKPTITAGAGTVTGKGPLGQAIDKATTDAIEKATEANPKITPEEVLRLKLAVRDALRMTFPRA